MPNVDPKSDKLGKFLIENIKNDALFWFDVKCSPEGASSKDRIAYHYFSELSPETLEVMKDSVNDIVNKILYNFLEKLHEAWDDNDGIEFQIDSQNIFMIDDEIKMNLFGENSWNNKYGKYPSHDQLTDKYESLFKKLRREGVI